MSKLPRRNALQWLVALSTGLLGFWLLCFITYRPVSLQSNALARLLHGAREDVLFSFIGDKNGAFRPTIEHLNSFVRSFRRFNNKARIVIFMTDNHRKGMMKV